MLLCHIEYGRYCCLIAGLSVEHTQEEALQAELSVVQAEEAALPLKISKLQEALQLENAELQRREAGEQVAAGLQGSEAHCTEAEPLYIRPQYDILTVTVAVIKHEESTRQETMNRLRHDLDLFRKRLGLRFRGVPGKGALPHISVTQKLAQVMKQTHSMRSICLCVPL